MSAKMLSDARARPLLFDWEGPLDEARLEAWLEARNLELPDDLKSLWLQTGGGEIFETESILGPFGDPSTGDDLEGVNRFHRERGMPGDYLVFHVGLGGLTAVRLSDRRYVQLEEGTYRVGREYPSLETWYTEWLRPEYGRHYRL